MISRREAFVVYFIQLLLLAATSIVRGGGGGGGDCFRGGGGGGACSEAELPIDDQSGVDEVVLGGIGEVLGGVV